MGLRVIGAGLGRTGTTSLRDALQHLLGGPCYHFEEVISHPEHADLWFRAIRGELADWEQIYGPYVATTDWPGAAFWRELTEAYPDAIVILSTRRSTSEWFGSVRQTIEPLLTRQTDGPEDGWHLMAQELLRQRFVGAPFDPEKAQAAYERHNAEVEATIEPSKLVKWSPGDEWDPLCQALGVPVPDIAFPHLNTRSEFRDSLSNADQLASTHRGLGHSKLGAAIRSLRPRGS